MLVEWSVECEAEDAVLIVPWSGVDSSGPDPSGPDPSPSDLKDASSARLRFINLRENPYDLDQIPEAEQHPALLHALRALNASRSPVFTAKCDAWTMDADELEVLRLNLDLQRVEAMYGFTSYIDLVWRERSIFASFHRTEQVLHRLTRHALPLDLPFAMLDCVVRPALIDLVGPQEGFAISLYAKAAGPDEASAYAHWAAALQAAAALLRGKDLALA